MSEKLKILPRNATAIDATMIATVSGNPDSSRMESGVGNCFPGLEFDIRNLERRFFPYLQIEILPQVLMISGVDIDGVDADTSVSATDRKLYRDLQTQLQNQLIEIQEITSNFREYGPLSLNSASFTQNAGTNNPPDIWTALRLIPPGESVTIRFELPSSGQNQPEQLIANRIAYIGSDGALSSSFSAGEMTQTLCQPWTYDFRDCGCWYWATNHPDTVQAEVPKGAQPNAILDRPTNWLRSDKIDPNDGGPPADSATRRNTTAEMTHYELANRWNELGIVLDGREQGDVYNPAKPTADSNPLPRDKVHEFLRYAASVEHSVMTEYLSAVYSLNPNPPADLSNDVRATHAEMLRIAYSEMRHLRLVNDLLRNWCAQEGLSFMPVLAPAEELPAGGGTSRPVEFRPLSESALNDFINIERPSFSVDGLYSRILDSMRIYMPGLSPIVETIIAEGSDHFESFLYIKQWLGQHNQSDYLLDLQQPFPSDQVHADLQQQYHNVLRLLFDAYSKGLPAGASQVNQARQDMVQPNGLRDACRAVRDAGLRVTFEVPGSDPLYTPIARPTA